MIPRENDFKLALLTAAGFDVDAPPLCTGVSFVVRAVLAPLAVLGAVSAVAFGWRHAAVLTGVGAAVVFGVPSVRARFARSMLLDACDVIDRALRERGPPDVVVAPSFGGAVVCALASRGDSLPATLLLAPAHALLASHIRAADPQLADQLLAPTFARVVVVHGDRDPVVPLRDSERLVAQLGASASLVRCSDDHGLRAFLAEGDALAKLVTNLQQT